MKRPPLATPAYELARRIVAKIVDDCDDRRGFHLSSLPSDIRFRMTRKWKELVAAEVEPLVRERDAEKRRADVAELRVEYWKARAGLWSTDSNAESVALVEIANAALAGLEALGEKP